MHHLFVALFALTLLSGCAVKQGQESVGQYIDNALITSKVKSKLLLDMETSVVSIEVTSYKGIVQLSGFVSNERAREKASSIAASVAGVREVVNSLLIKE